MQLVFPVLFDRNNILKHVSQQFLKFFDIQLSRLEKEITSTDPQ